MLNRILRFVLGLINWYRELKTKWGRLKQSEDTMANLHRQCRILQYKIAQCGAKVQLIRPAGVRDVEALTLFKHDVHKQVRNAQELYRQVVTLELQHQSLKAEENKLRRELGVYPS